MRKSVFLLQIMAFLLIFSSCSVGQSGASRITETMRNTKSAKWLCHITANFPEQEVKFTLDYNYSRDGDDRATVISPEEISGLAFTVSEKGAHVSFDGANLELGRDGKTNLSPISAIPSLVTVWTDGNISEAEETKIFNKSAYLIISRITHGDTPVEYRSWFTKEDFLPLYAEIFSDGERIIQCEFERAEHNLQ